MKSRLPSPAQADIAAAVKRAMAVVVDHHFWHRHSYVEFYYDIRSDELGGPRYYHEIAWACRCGRVLL